MIATTLRELAEMTGGEVHDGGGDLVVTAPAVVDSRRIEPGGLFAAIAGERVDGHEFAAAAVDAGAAAVLAARPVGVPAIVVADVTVALGAVAAALIRRLPDVDVVGITGSAGKTSAKDLVTQLVSPLAETVATAGNYNNEFGLPLTITRARETTRRLVLEMGATKLGDIAYLTRIVPPRIGVVLGVGTAHLDGFGSVEAIARGKGELVEALPGSGLAVLNADDPRVVAMADRTAAPVVTFGRAPGADVRAEEITLDGDGHPSFRLGFDGADAPVTLALLGAHQVTNALAAAAVARALGMTAPQVADGLSSARVLTTGRMEISEAGGARVVNDAYNCNPHSARAALDTLVAMSSGRTIAVLGPMLELAGAAPAEHRALGAHAAEVGVDHVVGVGEVHVELIAQGAREQGVEATVARDQDEALAALRALVRPGDTVLVKGQRVSELDRLADALVAALRETPVSGR